LVKTGQNPEAGMQIGFLGAETVSQIIATHA
jgi:hypothetical protein